MALEYFPCFYSYRKKIAKLSDQEVGRLFRHLLEYGETGETEELTGREAVAFDFIADDIDRAKNEYEKKCANNKKSIEARYERIRTNTNVYERIQTETEDKDKTEYKTDYIKEKSHKKKFVPPTLEEIKAYCRERGSNVNPKKFYDYFTADPERQWIDSKGKSVMNWKQKIITWEKNSGGRTDALINSIREDLQNDSAGSESLYVADFTVVDE